MTAYVIHPSNGCTINDNRTATGTSPEWGTVAVDPAVFPFGTHFRIPVYGVGLAADTGSYIQDRHIDVAVDSCEQAIAWGARRLTVEYQAP